MDLGKMGQNDIKANLESYVQAFSSDAREIFEHFKFSEFVGLLARERYKAYRLAGFNLNTATWK
jgi:DNA polymerase IIIc chi subunit